LRLKFKLAPCPLKMAGNVEAPFLRLGNGELLRHVLSMYRGRCGLRPLAAASRNCRNAVRAHVRRGIWMCGGTSLQRVCVVNGCRESLPVPWTRQLEHHSMTVAEGCLVVMGGCLDGFVDTERFGHFGGAYSKATAAVWRFDLVDHTWAMGRGLFDWRQKHCSASFGGDVYVVSGSYQITTRPFEIINPLQHLSKSSFIFERKIRALREANPVVEYHHCILNRVSAACAALGRYVYVAGGARPQYWESENKACCDMNRLSRLDTETGEWTDLAPMRNVRRGFKLLAHDGYLYAVGGQENVHDFEKFNENINYYSSDDEIEEYEFDEMEVLEVERYSPERDEWEDLGRLLPGWRLGDGNRSEYSYSDFSSGIAAVADGRLWIMCETRIEFVLMRYDAASNTFVRGAVISEDPAGQIGELEYLTVAVASVGALCQ